MRRCAISIPSNIAEGAGRESRPDYARFLGVAIGSAHELDYQLQLSKDLGYLGLSPHGELANDVVAVRSMIASLRKRVLANGGISVDS
jgi:four helix bundle protein